jgi:DNA replication protein DnaC
MKEIETLLESLRFKGMTSVLNEILKNVESGTLSFQQSLHELLSAEFSYRKERSLSYRIEQAKIPWSYTLSTYPFSFQPSVNKHQIMTLSDTAFVARGENIVFIGDTGTGKSGLATGLLREAIINGYRGIFYNVQNLLDDLYASLADRSTAKLLKQICRYDVAVFDELGYLALKPEQMNAFFKLIAGRYLSGKSTIITTNLEFDKWYDLLKPKEMVDAMLDRLRHRCIVIRIKGLSLRTLKQPS